MVYVSVIVPTHNRSKYLQDTIISLQEQNFPKDDYEIIVVDNNSTDDTPQVVEECNRDGKKESIYVKEPNLGLHNARHAGAKAAKGEILAYVDDDVICDKNWLSELVKPYADPEVGCGGGKILPKWEAEPPGWVNYFPDFLSILDRSDKVIEIHDEVIFGCNFSIKKDILYETGGFNPDAFPWNLIKYRGDGETGLLTKVRAKGYKIVYTPFAVVEHVISKDRLTIEYFKKRAFIEGIYTSYRVIRRNRGLDSGGCKKLIWEILGSTLSTIRRYMNYSKYIYKGQFDYIFYNELAHKYYRKGIKYHREEVIKDKGLLEYVLQENYLNVW